LYETFVKVNKNTHVSDFMEVQRIKCTSIGVYELALIRDKVYEVVDED